MDPIRGFAAKTVYPRCEFMAECAGAPSHDLVFQTGDAHSMVVVTLGAMEAAIFMDQHEAWLKQATSGEGDYPHYTVTVSSGLVTIERG